MTSCLCFVSGSITWICDYFSINALPLSVTFSLISHSIMCRFLLPIKVIHCAVSKSFCALNQTCCLNQFLHHYVVLVAVLRSIPTRGTASAARNPGSTTRSCCFTFSSNISDDSCSWLRRSPASAHFNAANHSQPPSNSFEITAEGGTLSKFSFIHFPSGNDVPGTGSS